MKQRKVFLNELEIKVQKDAIEMYRKLIEKELSYGDLVNVENVTKWTKAFKQHSQILQDGFVTIETSV